MNYSLANAKGPGKPKKRKGPITPEEAGKASRKARMERYSDPLTKKDVAETIERNVNVEGALKKGATLAPEGYYEGVQRHKKFKLKGTPKFRSKTKGSI